MATDDALPGLESMVPAATPHDGPMAQSARVTLAELERAGQIQARHAVLVQLVHSLAGAIDRGVQSGRASAVAMAAKQLLETMLVLDPPPEDPGAGTAADALAEFFRKVEEAANAEGGTP